MTNLSNWMRLASTAEQQALADGAGTSRRYLYQLASGHRNAKLALAEALEAAAKPLRKASKGRLPVLRMVP